MRMGKYLLAALMVLGIAGMVYAAPVGLTSEADATKAEWSYKDIELSIGFVADIVDTRKIDIDSGEFEIESYTARLAASLMDRFNLYVDLGQAQGIGYDYVIKGEQYNADFDDEFMWGVGVNALLYRWGNGLEIGVNASYRTADMNLEQVAIDNVTYARSALADVKDGEFQEYQGALEVAWRTDVLTPYAGVKVSEVEVDNTFSPSAGAERNASGKNASENVGVFVGLTLTPSIEGAPKSEQFALNVEGRFIDEEAFSVAASYKF